MKCSAENSFAPTNSSLSSHVRSIERRFVWNGETNLSLLISYLCIYMTPILWSCLHSFPFFHTIIFSFPFFYLNKEYMHSFEMQENSTLYHIQHIQNDLMLQHKRPISFGTLEMKFPPMLSTELFSAKSVNCA